MTMKVKWQGGRCLNSLFLSTLETAWNIVLPEDFKSVVQDSNRGCPAPYAFDTVKNKGRVFGGLLNFNLEEKGNVLEDYQVIKSRLPEKVFPFAEDPFGNFICFDFNKNFKKPSVIFWNHEGRVIGGIDTYEIEFVADSFTELLNKLYESPASGEEIDFSEFQILP